MKVRISKDEYFKHFDFYPKLPDFITLEAEPLTATECCAKCGVTVISGGLSKRQCVNPFCNCHKPTEKWICGKCTQEKDGVVGETIPEHSRHCRKLTEKCCNKCFCTCVSKCLDDNCPCHRKEEKCCGTDIPHKHLSKQFPPETLINASLKEIEELEPRMPKDSSSFYGWDDKVTTKINELIRAVNELRK